MIVAVKQENKKFNYKFVYSFCFLNHPSKTNQFKML